jgi:hypothetical protein
MSEPMRLANECKADRVDQFYAALHESASLIAGWGQALSDYPRLRRRHATFFEIRTAHDAVRLTIKNHGVGVYDRIF